MRLQSICAFLMFAPLAALGQQSEAVPERVRDVMIYAGTVHYPQELADKGVQGRVVFSSELRVDGTFGPSDLIESSGSSVLDAAATSLVANLKAGPQQEAKPVLLPILFYKDRVQDMHLKTCAQFNVDYKYFSETFPAKPVGDMNIFDMASGVAAAFGGINMSTIGRFSAAPKKTMEACAKRPKRLFLKEFLASVEQ